MRALLTTPFVGSLIAGLGTATPAPAAPPQAPAHERECDQRCLSRAMDDFLRAMVDGKPSAVRLSKEAELRENTRLVSLRETAWKDVKAIRSSLTFADPVTGNVVSRAGVELDDGKPAYISSRLKLVGGKITDVELSSDTSPNVVGSYVLNLDPRYAEILPPEQRLSRTELEALGRRYFQALTDHRPLEADFDESCNRYHSGRRITNVASNDVEGGAARTCRGSMGGNPPWGPAIEQRFPVIDPDRGIVCGVTLLLYPKLPNQPQMYVSEIFKVVGGRIALIDNIGIMMQGVRTLGFAH